MHRGGEVRTVQALAAQGLSASAIAKQTAIPRGTIRNWIAGQVPEAQAPHRPRAVWQDEIVTAHPEQFVRGLIHSDGCRVKNRVNGKDYPRYFFTQVSDDIRRLFCRSLTQLGIRYTWNDARNVSIAQRPDVARLDEFVGPKR